SPLIQLGHVTNTSINSATSIKSLGALDWSDTDGAPDAINAPSLSTLKITGDFGADIIVGTLGNATVAGVWSGDAIVSGNAGNLKMTALRGSLTISGSVKGIASTDHFALSNVASATGGSIPLGRAARVKTAADNLTITP